MEKQVFSTPVLFIVFNRPETTRRVFEAIRQAAPARLFVAADGPRIDKPGDVKKCDEVFSIVKSGIDWPCEVQYLRREHNLGCKNAVSSAIDWFFKNVEEGIILEDDCLPSPSFFPFCAELLNRYRNESRVAHIGGFNCQAGQPRGTASYYFSRYFHVWGWASWRRAWYGYDPVMKDYSQFLAEGILDKLFERKAPREFWKRNFDAVVSGLIDTWDYQWVYRNFKDDRLAAVANYNLVENIGFGEGATHTGSALKGLSRVSNRLPSEIAHPLFIVPDRTADDFTYRHHVGLDWWYDLKRPARKFIRALGLRS